MALDTKTPSVTFSPNRGKVEKNVSSTFSICKWAFSVRLATFSTTGVNFSGVKIKFTTIATANKKTASNAPNEIAVSRMVLRNFLFIFFP